MQVTESPEYKEQVAAEKRQFDLRKYDQGTLLEQISDGMNYVLEAFDWKVKNALGEVPFDYIVSQVNARPGAQVLSLGSGPCGLEIALAKRFTVPFNLTCLDLNDNLLELGRTKAGEEGIAIKTIAQDANFLKLDRTYDVILAHAALHHFINFEHIFKELHDHMSAGAVLIAHEPAPRNGMLLWPATKAVINHIFPSIPARHRRSLSVHGWTVHDTFPELDCAQDSFECIRSQDIVPLLEHYFHVEAKVPGFAFLRRFVEGTFGHSYDLTREQDRVMLDMLLAFDDAMVAGCNLKPENVFMVMKRKR